ncbi:hypothetical protein FRC07_005585 [Ceratobasidium sp. 392]|nr:hypothetical protein FRC07_005585 [Ceratobasidium sp. 392]
MSSVTTSQPRIIDGTASVPIATHPEGSLIWGSGSVVSNEPLNGPIEAIGKSLLERAGINEHTTVFVKLNMRCLEYYIVDHSAKTVTWVEGDSTPDAISMADPYRARNMLREEYWTHMENFPAPTPASVEDLQELKLVLTSLAVDSSTSDGSTSPFFSTAQIQEFLAMLNTFSHTIETHQTYVIARLWSMIWRARAVNSYGTTGACLDRFTPLSASPPAFSGPFAGCASLLVGAGADAHLARCSRAWAGRIAYVTEWRNFKAKNELEWVRTMYLACFLIMLV